MSNEHKIFIGISNTHASIPSGFFWSFINIKSRWPTSVFRSNHPWDVIRNNVIINKFLKSDCTILAKMDIDQVFPPNYFEKLVPLVDEYKVIGPLIYDRWEQNNFMPLAFRKENSGYQPFDLTGMSGIVEIPYAHTNLLYAREVFEKIPAPWYEAYQTVTGLQRGNHVDFDVLEKIHHAGYKVHIDLDLVVGHQYTTFVGRKFYQNWMKTKEI